MRSKTVKYDGQTVNSAAREKKGNEIMKIKGTKIINLLLAAAMTVSCFGQAVIASAEETAETKSYMLYDEEFDSFTGLKNVVQYLNDTQEAISESAVKDGVLEVSWATGFPYRRPAGFQI